MYVELPPCRFNPNAITGIVNANALSVCAPHGNIIGPPFSVISVENEVVVILHDQFGIWTFAVSFATPNDAFSVIDMMIVMSVFV